MAMGQAINTLISYSEYMTMLYPDYITIRDEIAYRYQKLVENMKDKTNNGAIEYGSR